MRPTVGCVVPEVARGLRLEGPLLPESTSGGFPMSDRVEGLSVVVPVFDEVGTVEALADLVIKELDAMGQAGELIFVDDGSRDGTREALQNLTRTHPRVKAIHLRRNFGKAVALTVGFSEASGSLILTMDGDLQDDPAEIPRMIQKLSEGYDLVSGWKIDRKDPWHKTIPSRFFNLVTSTFGGLKLKDHNSGIKLYRKEVLDRIDLVGEMHRFMTVMAHWEGFRVTEIPVQHHPRRSGRSKYGARRLLKGFFDFLTLLLTTRYNLRPLHLFGAVGTAFFLTGFGALSYLTVLWFLGLGPIGSRPLLFLGLLLIMVGVQLVSTGLLAELIIRQTLGTRKPIHDESPLGSVHKLPEVPDSQSGDEGDHPAVRG